MLSAKPNYPGLGFDVKRQATELLFLLLLLSTLPLSVIVHSAKSDVLLGETIYIRADGNVDPPTANISRNGDYYALTGNITSDADGIIIERNNTILEGGGFTIQGTLSSYVSSGIYLFGITNVTIKNMNIRSFSRGIYLDSTSQNAFSDNHFTANGPGIYLNSSSNNIIRNNSMENNGNGLYLEHSMNNSITGNNITASHNEGIDLMYSSNNTITGNIIVSTDYGGIVLYHSSNNNITRNTIANNGFGVQLSYSSNNILFHNNFDNAEQIFSEDSTNVWDDGFPSGGNYWSDYLSWCPNASEIDDSGIWDTPYEIGANNTDHYPLLNVIPEFPLILILPSFMLPTLAAVIAWKRRRLKLS